MATTDAPPRAPHRRRLGRAGTADPSYFPAQTPQANRGDAECGRDGADPGARSFTHPPVRDRLLAEALVRLPNVSASLSNRQDQQTRRPADR